MNEDKQKQPSSIPPSLFPPNRWMLDSQSFLQLASQTEAHFVTQLCVILATEARFVLHFNDKPK